MAVLTDARFSGVSTGACIGHVGPEALAGGPIGKLRDGDPIRIVIDRNRLEGSVDLVGEGDTRFGPEQGARVLAARAPRPDLAPDPDLPADTRLWAALQQAGGGTWGGCVYDVDAITRALERGRVARGDASGARAARRIVGGTGSRPASLHCRHRRPGPGVRRTAGLRIAGQPPADAGAAPAGVAARAHDRIVGERIAELGASLADLHAHRADPRMQRRVAPPEPDVRLAHLGAVEQQTELRVVELRPVGVERAADGGEARPAARPEGVEVVLGVCI